MISRQRSSSFSFFVFFLLFCLFLFIQTGLAQKTYKVEGFFDTTAELSPTTQVVATGNGGQYFTFPRVDGSFTIYEIPPGAYVLEVISTEYVFPLIRVDVSGKYNGKVKVRPANQLSTFLPYPISLKPLQQATFFEQREPFHMLMLFTNPMFLMIGFSLIMTILLPKMMASIDPEAMKELQNEQNDFSLSKLMPLQQPTTSTVSRRNQR
jgi:hypothetical protein